MGGGASGASGAGPGADEPSGPALSPPATWQGVTAVSGLAALASRMRMRAAGEEAVWGAFFWLGGGAHAWIQEAPLENPR